MSQNKEWEHLIFYEEKKKNLDFPDSHKHCKNVSVVKGGGGEIRKGL